MKVGFIGAGNMASAMIGGMLQKGLLQKEDIIASSATQKTADRVAQEFGRSLQWLSDTFGKPVKLIRTMPNTPALVGEAVTALCPGELVTDEELEEVCRLFRGFGKAEVVGEHLMDAVVAVSGSSPAYVFMFIEAMADAAVAEGMPRVQAYQFAAQSVLGSAKMVLETGKHPGELKDMVCSPAGTTIAGVCKLEEKGFRSSVMECMKACADKSRNM